MRQTKPRDITTTAPTAPWADDDDPIPDNIDNFRNELARRIAMFIGDRTRAWRDCPRPACRRARQCRPRQVRCRNAPQRPPATPEQWAHVVAMVRRALRQRLAESDGEKR